MDRRKSRFREIFRGEQLNKVSKFISFLFNLARRLTDIKAVTSGDPKKIIRRAKNKYIGKNLIRKIW